MSEDFFVDLGRTISKAANEVVDKTGEFFESTKIKAQISTEEKSVEKAYRDIGEIIYKQHMEGQPVSEEVAKICDDILSHEDRIRSFRTELANLKGMKICPACSEKVPKDVAFCPKCGVAMPVEEPEAAAEDIVETVEAAAADAAEEVKETVSDAAEEVKEAAKDVAEEVKDKAEDIKSDMEG